MKTMFHRPLLKRPLVVAATSLLMVACGFPGMRVDNGGLGNTPIGQLLAKG